MLVTVVRFNVIFTKQWLVNTANLRPHSLWRTSTSLYHNLLGIDARRRCRVQFMLFML